MSGRRITIFRLLGFDVKIELSWLILAALITYYAFVSLFPLLLLTSTILGHLLAGNPELQQQLIHSALLTQV